MQPTFVEYIQGFVEISHTLFQTLSPMSAAIDSPTIIQKEEVAQLHFPPGEVLKSADERIRRRFELDRAMVLGNMDHGKARITFRDTEGLKQVETTIWAVTEERVILKSGMVIPIRCITDIKT